MDQFKEFINLSGDILDSVSQAVGRNDYSGLNASIQSSIRQFSQNTGAKYNPNIRVNPNGPAYNPGATNRNAYPGGGQPYYQSQTRQTTNTRQQTANGSHIHQQTYRETYVNGQRQTYGNGQQGSPYPGGQGLYGNPAYRQAMNANNRQRQSANPSNNPAYTPFFVKKPGYGPSIAEMIIGIIGVSFNGILALICLIGIFLSLRGAIGYTAFFLLWTTASGFLLRAGVKGRKLLNKFYRYGRFLGNREFFKIEDLARQVCETPEEVYKNLTAMMQKSYLPQAQFDAANTTMMLTAGSQKQYQEAEASRAAREAEEKKQKEAREKEWANLPENVRTILREGEKYIQEVHHCNELIPGEEMTRKLSDLESIVRQIFAQLKEHPEQADDLRKLMNYYLPTTEKLLHAYIDLDKQQAGGQNVETARKEIEDVIDTINVAFQQLLDSLFQKVAWDVSTDISVMKSMMSQDGFDVMEDVAEEQAAPEEVEVEVETVEEEPGTDIPALEFGKAPEAMEPITMAEPEEPVMVFAGTETGNDEE